MGCTPGARGQGRRHGWVWAGRRAVRTAAHRLHAAAAHGRRNQVQRRPAIPCTMYHLLNPRLPAPTFSNSSLMGLMKALLTSSAASRPSCIAVAVSSTPKYTMTWVDGGGQGGGVRGGRAAWNGRRHGGARQGGGCASIVCWQLVGAVHRPAPAWRRLPSPAAAAADTPLHAPSLCRRR